MSEENDCLDVADRLIDIVLNKNIILINTCLDSPETAGRLYFVKLLIRRRYEVIISTAVSIGLIINHVLKQPAMRLQLRSQDSG